MTMTSRARPEQTVGYSNQRMASPRMHPSPALRNVSCSASWPREQDTTLGGRDVMRTHVTASIRATMCCTPQTWPWLLVSLLLVTSMQDANGPLDGLSALHEPTCVLPKLHRYRRPHVLVISFSHRSNFTTTATAPGRGRHCLGCMRPLPASIELSQCLATHRT